MRPTKLFFLFLLHFVGCKEDRHSTTERNPVAYKKNCDEPLGLENGDVDNSQILLSAPNIEGHGKENARLNSETSWVTNTRGSQFIQITFRRVYEITGLKTQGKGILRVTALRFQYKFNENDPKWQSLYEDEQGGPITYDANVNDSETRTIMFKKSIRAQQVRIIPVSWPQGFMKMALSAEILGCKMEPRSGCGGPQILTNSSGFISSSNYPNIYRNNENCLWKIIAPRGSVVNLTFVSDYHIEKGSKLGCTLDSIEVLDVVGSQKRSLGKFCGSNRPGTFTSTEEVLWVNFRSDHYDLDVGFKASYNFANASGCGGPQILTSQSGSISSDNYPNNYSNNKNCIWDIEGGPDELIEINFPEISISDVFPVYLRSSRPGFLPVCRDDGLQILTSDEGQWKPVQRYCGIYHKPQTFLSSTNKIRIAFGTNKKNTSKGFKAFYKKVKASGCGGKRDLSAKSGFITTPDYPKPYKNNLNCEWHILSHKNEAIIINFHDVNVDDSTNCTFSSISVYDGTTALLGIYCNGEIEIKPLQGYSGLMRVIFTSDQYSNSQMLLKGFNASYEIIDIIPSTNVTKFQTSKAFTFEKTFMSTQPITTSEKVTERTTEALMTSSKRLPGKSSTISLPEQMMKWFFVGIGLLALFLLVIIAFAIVIWCKHSSRTNTLQSLQGSFANRNNSGMMQNQAYDFSLNSTNHSIRSKQVEHQDSSHVSEPASQQGTLRGAPSQESHIYFSIEECPRAIRRQTPSIKSYYRRNQLSSTNNTSDESTANQSEYEDSNNFADEDDESPNESRKAADFRAISSDNESLPTRKLPSNKPNMVDNILYQSADDSGK